MSALPQVEGQPTLKLLALETPKPPERVAWTKLNGHLHQLRYWTAEEWAVLSPEHRPEGTIPGKAGGHFLIRPYEAGGS